MTPIIGHIIVFAVLCVIVLICGRNTFRIFRNELKGGGCASCPGGCSCGKCEAKGHVSK